MFLQVIENMVLYPAETEVFVQAKDLRANGVAVDEKIPGDRLVPSTVGFLRELAEKERKAAETESV